MSSQGKYDEAHSLYQQALSIFEEVLGPEHPSVAACLNNLAGLLRKQARAGRRPVNWGVAEANMRVTG